MAIQGEELQQLVRLLVPINGLPAHYQDQVIKEAEVLDFRKKETVFEQASRDNYSYYVLEGVVEMYADDQLIKQVEGGTGPAFHPLAQLQPRQMSARAKTKIKALRVNRTLLDKLLSVASEPQPAAGIEATEIQVQDLGFDADWLASILQSELFSRIPASNIEKLLATMEPLACKAGEVVIRQGDPGDYYYIVKHGRCEVTRRASAGGNEIRLAELGPGVSFGEEALVSDARRNATVRMLTDGELVRLTKNDFAELIKKPLLKTIPYEQALKLAEQGAVWLDVRFPDEHREACVPGSLNVPLNTLRMQAGKLDPDKRYIVYCDSGSRSSVAAFLLSQQGLDACYIAGGCMRHLAAAREPPRPQTPAALASAADPTEADVRASVLKAEVAKAALQLEEARRLKEEAEAAKRAARQAVEERRRLEQEHLEQARRMKTEAEAARRAAEQAAEEKARAERQKLEAEARRATNLLAEAKRLKEDLEIQRRLAEEEAERKRREQEEALRKLQAEAEQRLMAERSKLEDLYRRKAEEIEEAEAMKAQAQAQAALAQDRRRLEAESAEAKTALEEARRRLRAQQAQEHKLRQTAHAQILEERHKLEAEFARNATLLEAAQREKAAAEAARRAAAEEAEAIIAEYRETHEKVRAAEEARLRQEREALELEREGLRASIGESRRAREEALALQRQIEEQALRLRDRQRVEARPASGLAAMKLRAEIEAIDVEAAAAAQRVREATLAQEQLQERQVSNEQQLKHTFDQQEQLRKQLEQELDEWITEQERKQSSTAGREVTANLQVQSDRIKNKADQAKRQAQSHDESLLEELADIMKQI